MTESPLLQNLNLAQKRAVTHGNGPLLIVAGAGTGKTTVITRRLAWLIEQNLAKSNEILALTFTDKAAGELEERTDKLLPYGFIDLWIHTFHAFCDRILKQHGLDIGLPNDFKLLTLTDAWLLIRENLEKFDLDYYRPLGNPTKFIHALIKHFSRCKDEIITPEEYIIYADSLVLDSDAVLGSSKEILDDEKKRLHEIAHAYHTYNQILLDNSALDFSDLINYSLKLFKTRPKILEAYRQQFKYILIDEFQDTNLAQYELIKLLAHPKNNLTVVGDDDQSIYKFRGASISNILHFKRDYSGSALVTIIENFRSTQDILDKAYALIINNNPNRLEEKLKINKKLVAQEKGGMIEVIRSHTGEEEAKMVVKKIIDLKKSGEPKHLSSWNDFAILIRSNAEAESFMAALNREEIPFQFLASSGLYRQTISLDIIAYLKLLDNYHENTAVFRILNMPLWRIDSLDIVKITHQAKKKSWSVFETLKHAPTLGVKGDNCKTISRILGLIEKHTQLARTASVGRVILAFLEDTGYLKSLIQGSNQGEGESLRQISYLKEFYNSIIKFEQSRDEKLIKFYLEYLNYILESGEEGSLNQIFDEGPESVKIMTVHGAKGLEFYYIFLVNLIEQKFPAQNRSEQIEIPEKLIKEILSEGDIHIEEERRLFYVALTRAKKGVFFSYADFYGAGVRKRKASRFLNEIGLISKKDELKKVKEDLPLYQQSKGMSVQHEVFPLPSHFSFTQLKAFETCPYQYRFAHLLHIPTKGNATFSFGRTMHLTLQKFYNQIIRLNSSSQGDLFNTVKPKNSNTGMKVPSLEELLDIYDLTWIDDWYENKKQKESFQEKGKQILKNFYAQTKWQVPKFLEVGFHLKAGDYFLKGQIDRIDPFDDNTVELIDYKTGTPKKLENLSLDDKEQLLIYQLAATESLKEKPSLLSFYYLENNQKVSFLGTSEELQEVKTKIIKNIEAIKASNFSPKPSLFTCGHCDFGGICEFAE